MLDELKKPIGELVSEGKEAISNAVQNSDTSNAFFEKLSEKLSVYSGHTTVKNEELKYNRNYQPEGEDKE